MKYKLKQSLPSNIAVHTPTEEEAKELLEILHENGYRWNAGGSLIDYTNWCSSNCVYYIHPDKNIVTYNYSVYYGSIALAEFKERFVEEEKPRFSKGDKVIRNYPL